MRRLQKSLASKAGIESIMPQYVGPPSFIGGRNVDWASDMASAPKEGGVLPTQCIRLENLDIDDNGILVSRKGTDLINSSAINSGEEMYSMYQYYKASTASKYFIIHTDQKIGVVNLGTGAFTDKTGGLTIPTTPTKWITWNDMAYGFNGTGILKFDGTDLTNIQDSDADATDSVDGTVLDDILWTARDTGYASRVPYSNAFDAETWTATDFRRIEERDGQSIMSLTRLGSKILCLKDLSAWLLYGSSIYSFSEENLSREIGQRGVRAIASNEDKVFFQSNRGVEYFDQNSPRLFNNIARGTCAKEIAGYTRAQKDAAVMQYWAKGDRLFLSYPDLANPKVYVWFLRHPQIDEDGNIWFPHTVYTGITVRSMCVADVPGDEGKLYWGTDDGFIYEFDSGWDDNGTAIDILMEWGFTNAGIPQKVKNWSRAILRSLCLGTFTAKLSMDFGKKISSKTTDTFMPSQIALWDSAVWDSDLWAESRVSSIITRYNKMNGIDASLTLSRANETKTEIHPFKLEFYPKEFQRWP